MQFQKWQNDLCSFPRQPFNITVIQVYVPTSNAEEAEQFCEDLQDILELTPKKDVLFITGDWTVKVGNQEIPGVTGKFGLEVQNKAVQRLTEFYQENALINNKYIFSNNTRADPMHGYHQMVNTEIWLIIFSSAKKKKLYTVSKNKTRSCLWLRSSAPYWKIQASTEESGGNHWAI